LKPDILLLDLAMPKHPGLEALRELSAEPNSTPVRVILLTAAAEKSQIVEALQLGARGVVLKDSATQLLLKAIHTVMAGEYWVGRESVSNLVQYLRTLVQSSQRRGAAEEIRADAARTGNCFRGGGGILEQGNSRILQDQRRYGQTPSQQYLRQAGSFYAAGTGVVCRESGACP
jgi:CheY-like chemotaxis protein